MEKKLIIIFTIQLSLLLFSKFGEADEIVGKVSRIKDGDSLYIWNSEIRLLDIDAFEYSQNCTTNNREYACGEESTNALKELVLNKEVTCSGTTVDRYERLLATCFIGEKNINESMVASGWAINYNNGVVYIAAQKSAELGKRGVWAGQFIDPSIYRKQNSQDARAEQKFSFSKGGDSQCIIKGNINSSGEKIYHTPWGSKNYNRTKVSVKEGERWFCSEAEALAAGWRAPF